MGFHLSDVARGDVEAVAAVPPPPTRPQTDVAKLLEHGGVVVVVGTKPTQFSHAHINCPRIVFWHGTDPKTDSPNRTFPANARAVLFGGICSHSRMNALRQQATSRGMWNNPSPMSTGDMREILDRVVSLSIRPPAPDPDPLPMFTYTTPACPKPEPEEPMTMPRLNLRALRRGELKVFVERHAVPTEKAGHQAPKLLAMLTAEGIRSTLQSVDQAIRFYVTVPHKKQKVTAPTPSHVPAVTFSEDDFTPTRPPAMTASSELDLALLAVKDIQSAAAVLAEALVKIQQDVQRLHRQKATAKQALEEYLT